MLEKVVKALRLLKENKDSSAVREWLKILVYGGTLEMLRRLVF